MRLVKYDAAHKPIRRGLTDAGVILRDVAHLAGFGCDIVARHVRTLAPVFIEIKNPGPPSACKLTPSEERLKALFPKAFFVVQTIEEAFAAVGLETT